MKNLYKVLPPFAPDYSGVCSVLFEMGGILIIHDAGGCTGNFTGYDEPRWYGNKCAVFSSELREIDAVFGGDDKLIEKIMEASQQINRNFITILGSPSPMVIGTDYKAIARILEEKIEMPVFAFDTNGMDYYDTGASEAFFKLADYFVRPPEYKIKNSVNILGASPLDLGLSNNIDDIIKNLCEEGFEVLSCWCMGTNIEEILLAARAKVNIVVSVSGLKAARLLKDRFGIPYLVGIPIGEKFSMKFYKGLRNLMEGKNEELSNKNCNYNVNNGEKALLIGEQIMGNSFRKMLKQEMGFEEVVVASFFKMDEELTQSVDIHLKEEDKLFTLMEEERFDLVIGDPLYKELMNDDVKNIYVDLPHVAVSSRLYWDEKIEYIGDKANRILINQGV